MAGFVGREVQIGFWIRCTAKRRLAAMSFTIAPSYDGIDVSIIAIIDIGTMHDPESYHYEVPISKVIFPFPLDRDNVVKLFAVL